MLPDFSRQSFSSSSLSPCLLLLCKVNLSKCIRVAKNLTTEIYAEVMAQMSCNIGILILNVIVDAYAEA